MKETTPLLSVVLDKPIQDDIGRIVVHDEEHASFLNLITFTWLGSVVRKGAVKAYTQPELPPLRKVDTAKFSYSKLWNQWLEEDKLESPTLSRAIRMAFGYNMYIAGACKLFGDLLGFVGPVCLNAIVKYLEDPSTAWFYPKYFGYILSAVLFLSTVAQSLLLHQHHHIVIREGIRCRASLISIIFRKSLVLAPHVKQEYGTGRIVNHQSTDAGRLMDLFYFFHYIWAAPLQILLTIYLLVRFLGYAAFAGLGVMVLLLPFSAVVAHFMGKITKKMIGVTDERVKFLNELFQGIRVVKFYAWEHKLKTAVEGIRQKELGFLKKFMIFFSFNQILLQIGPVLVALSSFALYTKIEQEPLTADKAFTALSLFNILRLPLMMLPRILTLFVQAGVSCSRIQEFLLAEEIQGSSKTREIQTIADSRGKNAIDISGVNFLLNKNDKSVGLFGVNLSVPKGSFYMVVGAVGSGKSSLCAGLLEELYHENGSFLVSGSIAFVAQQAWILNATVRDNILFGEAYDAMKFRRVIKLAALEADLKTLTAGIETEIGERGVTLSGGQKQRISIARALYADRDIYIFDDCLSALDSYVGRRIFEDCIWKALDGKTRILVTHAIQYAEKVDKVCVMEDMKIVEIGTYDELRKPNTKFSSMASTLIIEDDSHPESAEELSESEQLLHHRESMLDEGTSTGKLIEDEEREIGSVSGKIYISYLSSCGLVLVGIIATFMLISRASNVSRDIWLSYWTKAPDSLEHTNYYLVVYAALSFGTIASVFVSDMTSRFAGIHASRVIHSRLFDRVLRAPMQFFDTTPLGRVINRFSNDMNSIDLKLGASFVSQINISLTLLGMLAVQCYSEPILICIIVPIMGFYSIAQQYYRRTSRELQRLDSISKSPIYAHFGQTLNGLSTLRAYGMQDDFTTESDLRVDSNTRAFLLLNMVNRWLGVRLEFLGAIITLSVALFVNASTKGKAAAALGGLVLSYSQGITQLLNWAVRVNIDTENMMNAVERTDEYSRIESEAPAFVKEYQPPSNWPSQGCIEFRNVSARYRIGLDLVLKNISLVVKAGEKVGVCGRTGSGKSSLLLTLFRMLECCEGSIKIDNLNIGNLGLFDLRSHLAIIPQEPVLFANTIRFNLDPFNKHTNAELWSALEKARLYNLVQNLPKQLENMVGESGENFSTGERQLFCLARALLKNSTILLLDEATASVDQSTDDFIQERIRLDFKKCTVIAIAHRLETIMDYDKVLVLGDGKILEYDTPRRLLDNEEGALVELAGNRAKSLRLLT